MKLNNKSKFRFWVVIFFYFLLSCKSADKEKDLVDLDFFRNQGKKIILSNYYELANYLEVNKVNKFKYILNEYPQNYDIFLEKKIQKNKLIDLNKLIKSNILYNKEGIIFIDENNNLIFIDYNFKQIKKISFIKNKKKINLNFYINFDGKNIVVATSDGRIFLLNFNTEEVLWNINLGVPVVSEVIFFKDNIYFMNSNSKIYSINSISGSVNWSYETVSENFKSKNTYYLKIIDNILVFSNDNADLVAIDIQKNFIIWSINLRDFSLINHGGLFEIQDIIETNKNLYISTNTNGFFKIDLFSGSVFLKKNFSMQTTPLLYKNFIFFITKSNFFICFDEKSNQIVFSKNLNIFLKSKNIKELFFSNIILMSNSFYLTSKNSSIAIKISLSNLNSLKLINLKKSLNKNFFIFNKNIFFTDNKNKLNKIFINDN